MTISTIYSIALFTHIFLLYSNVHKKLAFKCLFTFPLWHEIDDATFRFSNTSSEILTWKQNQYIPKNSTSRNYLLLNMAVWWCYISRRGRDVGGEGGTGKEPLPDKPPLMQCGQTYRTWQQ